MLGTGILPMPTQCTVRSVGGTTEIAVDGVIRHMFGQVKMFPHQPEGKDGTHVFKITTRILSAVGQL
jgi:hypothetical protein